MVTHNGRPQCVCVWLYLGSPLIHCCLWDTGNCLWLFLCHAVPIFPWNTSPPLLYLTQFNPHAACLLVHSSCFPSCITPSNKNTPINVLYLIYLHSSDGKLFSSQCNVWLVFIVVQFLLYMWFTLNGTLITITIIIITLSRVLTTSQKSRSAVCSVFT